MVDEEECEIVKVTWALEMEQRVTRLEAQQEAADRRQIKIDYALNHHTHDKTKETPSFEHV